MPKDQFVAEPPPPAAAAGSGEPLKRNQACLTCRRRKTKCDAEKPACSTCMRSWRHKVQHLPAGREPPPQPVCDYTPDEELEREPARRSKQARAAAAKKKGKEDELEGRIQMLEEMLKIAVGAGVASLGGSQLVVPPHPQQQQTTLPGNVLHSMQPGPSTIPAQLDATDFLLPQSMTPPQTWTYESPTSTAPSLGSGTSVASGSGRSMPTLTSEPSSGVAGASGTNMTPESMDSPDEYLTELLWPGWPPHLPHPGLMDHFANVFLNSVPVVHGLLDQGRFLTRLSLPPSHHDFPHPAVLHAICAVASRYTAVVQMTPPDSFKAQYPRTAAQRLEEPTWPMSDGLGQLAEGGDDFGVTSAKWARMYFEASVLDNPSEWLSLALAAALLAVYHHASGQLAETWTWAGQAARLAIPVGLNTSGVTGKGPRLADPPADEIDRAERANLWWLIFTYDTFASTGSGWAGSLSIGDISTILPVGPPGSPTDSAQKVSSPNLLTDHPEVHANGVGLRIKATILLRKVGDFIRMMDIQEKGDLRQDPLFLELDRQIMRFGESFPANCKDALKAMDDVSGRSVDPDMYLAHCLWPTALLVLHGNQFDAANPNDYSTSQVRRACNIILDRIFRLSATSHDASLLNPLITLSYFVAAKADLRMIQSAMEAEDLLAVVRLKSEIEVFKTAIDHVGSKLPIGVRHSNMISGIISMLEKRFNGEGDSSCNNAGSCVQLRFNMAGGIGSRLDRPGQPATDCFGKPIAPPAPTSATPAGAGRKFWST